MNQSWKAIILAGGTGSRLHPLTASVNKHLLPVYDKPMIYYPLTSLMLGRMRDFLLVTSPDCVNQFKRLLGDGSQWGISIEYRIQERPGGIAEAFRICADDIAGHNVALMLGDNILYGAGLSQRMRDAADATQTGATIFAYEVRDPRAFGVVEIDGDGKAASLEEKPKNPKSNFAVPGLYFYDRDVGEIAASLKPSARGELEITDVNRAYMQRGDLRVMPMGRGMAWLDGGSASDLYEASQFVQVLEERSGLKIACPEEIAFRMEFIDQAALQNLIEAHPRTSYRRYLERLI